MSKKGKKLTAWLLTLALLLGSLPLAVADEAGVATPGEATDVSSGDEVEAASQDETPDGDVDAVPQDGAPDGNAEAAPQDEMPDGDVDVVPRDEMPNGEPESNSDTETFDASDLTAETAAPAVFSAMAKNTASPSATQLQSDASPASESTPPSSETCAHSYIHYGLTRWSYEPSKTNPANHIKTTYKYDQCGDCGKVMKETVERTEEIPHEDSWTSRIEGLDRYEPNPDDPKTHLRYDTMENVCGECGAHWGRFEEQAFGTYEHTFQTTENGAKCEKCGYAYECAHENQYDGLPEFSYKVVPELSNDKTHTLRFYKTTKTFCKDCKEYIATKTEPATEEEAQGEWDYKGCEITKEHDYFLGYCRTCSRECPYCGNPAYRQTRYAFAEDHEDGMDSLQIVSYDEKQHTLSFYRAIITECSVCENVLGEVASRELFFLTEDHEFHGGDTCIYCNYVKSDTCDHQRTVIEEAQKEYRYEMLDADSHKKTHYPTTITRCEDCGAILKRTSGALVEETEAHFWYEDVKNDLGEAGKDFWYGHNLDQCVDCGYTRKAASPSESPAPSTSPEPSESPEPSTSPSTSPSPKPTPAEEDTPFVPTPKPTPAPETGSSGNGGGNGNNGGGNNGGGNTGNSGYVPSPGWEPVYPGAMPEATPAPQEMVKTLLDAVEAAQDGAAAVDVEVVGAQEVMTGEEYAALRALPAQEQVLVTLTAIGMGDAVEAATRALGVALSADAQALSDGIAARMAAATDADRAALEAKLAELFPVTTITENGVVCDYFCVTLEVTVDGVTTTYRYGFRYDAALGEWVFVLMNAE